jgi:hypothetical protein
MARRPGELIQQQIGPRVRANLAELDRQLKALPSLKCVD